MAASDDLFIPWAAIEDYLPRHIHFSQIANRLTQYAKFSGFARAHNGEDEYLDGFVIPVKDGGAPVITTVKLTPYCNLLESTGTTRELAGRFVPAHMASELAYLEGAGMHNSRRLEFFFLKQEIVETLTEMGIDLSNQSEAGQEIRNGEEREGNIFQGMDGLLFSEITMRLDPTKIALQIDARGRMRQVRFFELGLTSKRGETVLNRQGQLLTEIIRGEIATEQGRERALQKLSRSLRVFFGTADPPFSRGRPRFEFSVPQDVGAKRQGRRKSISLSSDAKRLEAEATRILETHRSDFDEDHPSYDPAEDS